MESNFTFYVNNTTDDTYVAFRSTFGLEVGTKAAVVFNNFFGLSTSAFSEYGYATIKIDSFGGEIPPGYGAGTSEMPKIKSWGEGGFYVPPPLQYGFSIMPQMSSSGFIVTSRRGDGTSNMPKIVSKGGEGGYGEGFSLLPEMTTYGEEGPDRLEAWLYSYVYLLDGIVTLQDHLIVINETGQITDSITADRSLIEQIVEKLSAAGAITAFGTFTVPIFSSGELADSQNPTVLSGSIEKPSLHASGAVWVVNIETGATTQYDGYGFNDFFERDNKYYGIADDGIYELSGDKDAGMDIPAEIDFGSFKFGSQTKVREFYVGVSSKDEIYLKVTVGADTYTYKARSSSEYMENHRVDIGRGLKGMYWELVLQGEDFEMDLIEFSPINLRKRVK